MKKNWIIGVIALVMLGILPLKAQNRKSSIYEPDIVDKPKEIIKDSVKKDFIMVDFEQMPQFPGGEGALLAFIHKNLHYPPIGEEQGMPGRVVVRFMITETGSVTKVEILRSLDPACDKEAIRVVKLLPKFIPGKLYEKNAAFWYTLPVSFKHD